MNPRQPTPCDTPSIAFIGGGNMASALIGGLLRQGTPAQRITAVEPLAEARARLQATLGVHVLAQASAALQAATVMVWAVKPQVFKAAAQAVQPWAAQALHLSVAAGIRTASMAQWLGSQRLARAMPNTPALVGHGMTGLYASAGASAADRNQVEQIIAPTGQHLWVAREDDLDAVTALSGSGPAYVFYFLEAMQAAGVQMGLPPEQAYQLAVATFAGATELARTSNEPPQTLRERVTSKGGTTHAAITTLQTHNVSAHFQQALDAACRRARELGDEFGH